MNTVVRLLAELEGQQARQWPLQDWQPPCCGVIDIRIDRAGDWYHQGVPFQRASLVRLLSTLLRHDADGYCLVTPAEKWLLTVEDMPFVAHLDNVVGSGLDQQVFLRNTVGDLFRIDADHPLQMRGPTGNRRAYAAVRAGLEARILSAAFYQMADLSCEVNGQWGIFSAGQFFCLE